MYTTLDFAGLSVDQAEAGSILIGGSARKLFAVKDIPVDDPIPDPIDWRDLGTIVVRWGDQRIDEILHFATRHRSYESIDLAALIGQNLWQFQLIKKIDWRFDPETEEAELQPYDPREEGPPTLVLPWDGDDALKQVQLITSGQIKGVRIFGETTDFFLQFSLGTEVGRSRHTARAAAPITQELEFDFSFEGYIGWPKIRFNQAPSSEVTKELADKVAPLGIRPDGRCDPQLILDLLGIEVAEVDELGLDVEATITSQSTAGKEGFLVLVRSQSHQRYQSFLATLELKEQRSFEEVLRRFIMGHELGHTFFSDWRPKQIPSAKPVFKVQGWNLEVERFCDRFAEELISKGASPEEIAYIGVIMREGSPKLK